MHWQTLLIFVIGPAVLYILNQLFRNTEEEQQKGNRPRTPPRTGRPPAQRPRATPSDIDRFLEEINRRRREGAERPPKPPEGGERASPSPGPTRTQPARTVTPARPSVATAVPAARRPEPIPEVIPVEEKPGAILQAVPVGSVTPGTPPAAVAAREPSAVLVQLLPLLRSPQTLKAALLVKEVLDRPLCQRRRGPLGGG